jgi:hypothetical protein
MAGKNQRTRSVQPPTHQPHTTSWPYLILKLDQPTHILILNERLIEYQARRQAWSASSRRAVPRRRALLRLSHRVQPPFLALARRRSREPPPSLLLPVKDAVTLCRTPLPGSPPMSRSCAAARLYSEVPVVRRRHPTSSPSSRIPWMWPPPPVKEVLPSHLPAGRGRRRPLSCAAAKLSSDVSVLRRRAPSCWPSFGIP